MHAGGTGANAPTLRQLRPQPIHRVLATVHGPFARALQPFMAQFFRADLCGSAGLHHHLRVNIDTEPDVLLLGNRIELAHRFRQQT